MSTVFRVEKTANYTVMSNTHLKDRRLSYKSKGLLSVILSLPPDWDYTITGLSVIAADGVDSVKTAIKELEQYGYVSRTQLRDERGRMAQNEYRVYENPTDNPDYVPSEQVSPEQDAPDEKPSRAVPKKKSKCNFSVSPSAENPSTVTPTADNTQADTIKKLNINILNTDKSIHSFTPAQAQEREDRIELIDKGKNISFSSVAEREIYGEIIRENISYEDKYARNIGERQQVDELVSIMTDVICSSSPMKKSTMFCTLCSIIQAVSGIYARISSLCSITQSQPSAITLRIWLTMTFVRALFEKRFPDRLVRKEGDICIHLDNSDTDAV